MEPDVDVIAEEERVEKLQPEECLVRVNAFRQVYSTLTTKSLVAVEKSSFAIEQGECFALLGVNGAGKTSTFKSLTAAIIPTSGDVSVMGYNIQTDFDKAR